MEPNLSTLFRKSALVNSFDIRDFKIVHDGRLGRLDAYTGDLGRVR